jgi:hypothetical protein
MVETMVDHLAAILGSRMVESTAAMRVAKMADL